MRNGSATMGAQLMVLDRAPHVTGSRRVPRPAWPQLSGGLRAVELKSVVAHHPVLLVRRHG